MIIFCLLLYLFICITIKRFHDIGLSGDNIILLLIPIINIYIFMKLVFQKGIDDKKLNRKS